MKKDFHEQDSFPPDLVPLTPAPRFLCDPAPLMQEDCSSSKTACLTTDQFANFCQ